tara:strand:+ start:2966 stop:3589 length:624 start_codon:yes stop_codon:yes gene_type:complete
MKKIKRLGGWQCWVDIYDKYVIKTPKNREEIEEEVKKFLIWKKKLGELDKRTDKMILDIKDSTRIIKRSKIPRKLLADLEFLNDGRVKQKRVVVLDEKIKKLSESEQKKLINNITKFILDLWEYGIHEKTFKVFSNLGLNNGRIVLIDIFEITSNKKKVIKQLRKKLWQNPERFKKHLSEKMAGYLIKKLDKTYTRENLEKYWKIKK